MPPLALIDLDELKNAANPRRGEVLDDLHKSLSEYGAVFIKNNVFTEPDIDQALNLAQKLFNLPAQIKEQYLSRVNGGRTGFIPYATESADAQFEPDPKETWHISREPSHAGRFTEFYIQNFWPAEITQFKPFFIEFYRRLDEFAADLVTFSLEALYRDNSFPRIMEEHNSVIRLTNYVNDPNWTTPLDFLANEHRDVDLFTLHLATTATGCEFLKESTWHAPVCQERAILASVGSMLDRLSNGKYSAPLHRVRNTIGPNHQRLFLGYFVNPSPDVLIESYAPKNEVKKYEGVENLALLLQRASDTRVL